MRGIHLPDFKIGGSILMTNHGAVTVTLFLAESTFCVSLFCGGGMQSSPALLLSIVLERRVFDGFKISSHAKTKSQQPKMDDTR
jgi:hypothetical protein